MSENRLLLKGGTALFPDGSCRKADILVENGRIAATGDELTAGGDTVVYDLTGMHLFCGLVDVHVHLREPGFAYKESIASGTRAAAHGGFTTVCAMPNVNPVPDSPENLKVQQDIIDRDAVVKVLPYGSITRGRKGCGEVVDMARMQPSVAGFSDDGCGVSDDSLMEQAMRLAARCGALIAAHCEDERLTGGGCIHDGDYARRNNLRGISSESEWRQVMRDAELAAKSGCRYHVCHVSTAESVELIRSAKARGTDITCETAPHYLLLCDEELHDEGRFKMNPPLRSRRDREALRKGIADGTVDMIATDHAPHSAEEKSRGLEGSAFGISGLETSFALMYTEFVRSGEITLHRLLELMCYAPRRRFGLGGSLAAGEAADIAVFDLGCEYAIRSEEFLSAGRATPFEGRRVFGRCVLTLVDGKTAYEALPAGRAGKTSRGE